MATVNDWLEGARLRTLPAAVAPVVIAGSLAWQNHALLPHHALGQFLACLAVALCFQLGVNFANDYSDGIRGTDNHRQGPARLTGGGKAKPRAVLLAALGFLFAACLSGLVVVHLSGKWWLILLGAACALAAWFYTGGKRPYGYLGLGEVFVFLTFGLMATTGTYYVQSGTVPLSVWIFASAIGFLACALLMVNNIRDIQSDKLSQKFTLATRLGSKWARRSYAVLMIFPFILSIWLRPFTLLGLPLALYCAWRVLNGQQGKQLISVLRDTGFVELLFALGVVLSNWL